MRKLLPSLLAAGLFIQTGMSLADHGWSWTSGTNLELSGVIQSVRLGKPHGIVKLDVNGTTWTLELGPPQRNENAGLKNGDLAEGVEILVVGEPDKEVARQRMLVKRLSIGDREYDIYPERE